jgi:hypothetical protein
VGFSRYYRTRDLAGTAERARLLQPDLLTTWRHWGPYLSDRQWGTVREWYDGGDAWTDVSHDKARSRTYRWGEDGILGISGPAGAGLLLGGDVERSRRHHQGAALRP